MVDDNPRESIQYRHLVRIFSLIAAGTGFVALLGWALQRPFLASFGSGKLPMAPSAALLFILYGIAIFLRADSTRNSRAHRVGQLFNIGGTLIALPLFFLSILRIRPAFEHFGFQAVGSVGGSPIGHISPVTALCFLLASLSFFTFPPSVTDRSRRAKAALYLASLLVATSFALLVAYLFGTPLFSTGSFIPPAAPTSFAFAALGVALIGVALPHSLVLRREEGRVTRTEYVLLLVFVLLAAGIVTVGYLYQMNYERRYRDGVERQITAIAELKVEELVQYRKERMGDAAIYFRNASFSTMVRRFFEQPGDAGARRQVRAWIGNYGAQYESDRVFLLDDRGETRMSVPGTTRPADPTITRRASEIAKSGQVTFQDFYRSGISGRIYLAVLIPILDEQGGGRPLGVLVLRVAPERYLYPLIRHWPIPSRTAETLLVRRDGDSVLVLNNLRFDNTSALTLRLPLEPGSELPAVKAVLGKNGIVEGRDTLGDPVLADVRAVPDSPWFVVASMNLSEIYGPARERIWWMLTLVGVLLVSAASGVGLAWRHQQARSYRERYEMEREHAWLQDVISRSLNEIYIFDPTTLRFKFVNTGGLRNIGYGMEELALMTPVDIKPEYTEESFRAMIQPLLSGQREALVFETVHRRKDGSVYPVEAHLQLVSTAGTGVFLAIVNDITGRKQAERTLRESEDRFRDIVEHSQDLIFTHDLEGRILSANPRAAVVLGYSQDELLRMEIRDLLAPEVRHDFFKYRDEIRTHGTARGLMRVQTGTGERRLWEYKNTLRTEGVLEPVIRGMAQDVTERKQAERALKDSEERFRALFEDAKDGIVLVDVENRKFHMGNNTFCDMVQYALDEVRQLGILDIHPEEDVPWIIEEFDRRARHEPERKIDIPVKRKDGSIFWADIKSSPVTISGKEYVLGNFRDVTARRKAEESLARLGMAVEQSAEAIVITDREGTIQYVNPAFERISGFSREESVGKTSGILRSGMHDNTFYREMWAALLRGEVWEGHFINRKKDGSLYEEDATISPVRDSSGNIVSFVAVKRDVTKLLLLEKQVRSAQKMEAVGTLAGGIAHDFNNALTGIVGFGELLRMRMAGDGQALHDLDEIMRCAERAATLTRQMLTFARRQVIEPVNLDLTTLVADLMKLIGKVVGEQIEVTTSLKKDVPVIHADRGQIEQLIMNLCLNARDAMPNGGRLVVETEGVNLEEDHVRRNPHMSTGRYALLTVSDTGIGMDEKTCERVFEPFFTTKGPDRGTGLGLAMVYGIVKQQGGFIRLHSEPGKGTSFKVYLSAIDAQGDASPGRREEEIVRGGTETILLAEDEDAIRGLAERVLTGFGYTVLVARNGEEAIEVFRREKEISLAVLDVVMPRKGGKETFEEMRGQNPELKGIFMSGYSADGIHDSFVLIPGMPFLPKPFSPTMLARKVREVLDTQ